MVSITNYILGGQEASCQEYNIFSNILSIVKDTVHNEEIIDT